MKKMEIIRAIIELTGMGILKSRDSFRLIEKVVKDNKQSKYGEESKPTKVVTENSEEVNELYQEVKPLLKPKMKIEEGVDYTNPELTDEEIEKKIDDDEGEAQEEII